ncbi:MAG TPA: hypothetical protein PLA70_12175 [Tenuifilaceae bacterium]|nr:hypothetical protein [Tenuifilaceae bacterium]
METLIMSPSSRREYTESVRQRYSESEKQQKTVILDEFCQDTGYNRKYAIRVLGRKRRKTVVNKKRGRKRKYGNPLLLVILYQLWRWTNLPCSKRLKAIIPIWLPYYPSRIPRDIAHDLYTISASTIDRLMKHDRFRFRKLGLSTTKPGSLLKKHIPIAKDQWDESRPGFLEVDSVAHCGSSAGGSFALTINCVDIATTWTEQAAVWGKGETGVLNALTNIENRIPFKLLGFDCDNGSEFLNWHILHHYKNRKTPVHFTRSRPYFKNDNAHIEEKNWTHVRQYLGYQRFDKIELIALLNDLFETEWRLYFNFFIPSVKLIDKIRDGSKIKKKYDPPRTPFQRVLESPAIPEEHKAKLKTLFSTLNPIQLRNTMHTKITQIQKMAIQ